MLHAIAGVLEVQAPLLLRKGAGALGQAFQCGKIYARDVAQVQRDALRVLLDQMVEHRNQTVDVGFVYLPFDDERRLDAVRLKGKAQRSRIDCH